MTGRATRVLSTAKDDRLRRASILSGSKPFSTLDERSEWVWNGVGWELRPFKEAEVEFECDGRSQLEWVWYAIRRWAAKSCIEKMYVTHVITK